MLATSRKSLSFRVAKLLVFSGSAPLSSFGTHQILPKARPSHVQLRQAQGAHSQSSSPKKIHQRPSITHISSTITKIHDGSSPTDVIAEDLRTMTDEIHHALDSNIHPGNEEVAEMSKYYFDGQGKAIRPAIALILG
jgi:hypothetical protein